MADNNVENPKDYEFILESEDPNYVPTTKDLLKMLETADMDEETKQSLRSMLANDVPQFFGGQGSGTILAIVFASLIFLIIFAIAINTCDWAVENKLHLQR
ncbi:unnamed protein product [Euphydryas editha]|uniref:Uncharacterized protein n=1 Tax=Euphydryas editha TaxID=104508 RepID=A0AAU9TFI0_EUPED|nr:unnamed protein product [Euphydryas editha]